MANYANTKSIIAQNIYTNHEGKVTAEMVKTAANEIVNTLIAGGYLYAGIAHPGDAAVSPDANVFYIASEAGTYTNKGGLVVADGEIAVLKYNGTWSKELTGAATAAQVTELGQLVSTEIAYSFANYSIRTDGTFGTNDSYFHGVKKVSPGEAYILRSVSTPNQNVQLNVAFATSNTVSAGGVVPVVNGTIISTVPVGSSQMFIIPEGCNYLLFNSNPTVINFFKFLGVLDTKIERPSLYKDNDIALFDNEGNVKDSGIAIDEIEKKRTKIPIVQSGKYIVNNIIDITTYATTDSTVWGYIVIDVTAGDKFYLDVAGGSTPRAYAFTNKGDCIIKYCDSGRFTGTIIAPSDGKMIINNNFATLPEPTIYKLNENDGRIGDYNAGVISTKYKRAGDSVDLTPVLDYNTRRKWNYTILNCQAGDVFNIIGKCSDSGYATLLCFIDSANKYIGGTFTSQQFKNKTVKCPVGTVQMVVQFNNSEDFSIYKLDSYQEKIYVNREDYVEQTGDIFTGDVYKVKSVSGIVWSQWKEPLAETYSKEDINLTAAGYVDVDGLVGVAVLDDAGIYTCCPFYNSVVGDDHNNSAVRFVDNKLYVGCGSGHTNYKNGNMYMAVFDNPFDLTEYTLHVMPVATTPDDKTTYCQMFYYDGNWYMFYRGADTGWDCLKTADFTNLTVITSNAGIYCCFHKVKGHDNLFRIVSAENGAFANNFIKEAILDLDDMTVKDDNLNVLGDYANLGTIFNSVQSLVPSTLGDYDHIRLFDTSVPETELNNIIVGFARYQLGENDGKYYMYLNGSVVEVDDCGEPFYPASQYLPGIAICEYNTNFIVYAKKIGDVSYLCSAYITENTIRKEVIDSSKVLLIRPYFIKNDMNRIIYLRGIYPSGSYLDANMTLLKKDMNVPM